MNENETQEFVAEDGRVVFADGTPIREVTLKGTADVPPGTYLCSVEDAFLWQNKNNKRAIRLKLRLWSEPYMGRRKDYTKYLADNNYYLFLALGSLGYKLEPPESPALRFKEMPGLIGKAVLKSETYADKDGILKTGVKVEGFLVATDEEKEFVEKARASHIDAEPVAGQGFSGQF